jgi:hypothetical protein
MLNAIDITWPVGQCVNMKKEFGGLRFPNIRELNLCLLGSWIRRYSLDDKKI